jgi:hypothetical protein
MLPGEFAFYQTLLHTKSQLSEFELNTNIPVQSLIFYNIICHVMINVNMRFIRFLTI